VFSKLKTVLLTSILIPSTLLAFDDFSDDLPIITSATRLSQSVLSSPSAVTVIDSDMIEASGFTDIADLMRLVPGFIVAHTVHGAYTVINHGEGWEYPNRLQIMIDGRSTYTSALSGIAWNVLGIHIEDIDRIEVVRGPAASAYGSNSYSGAINIISKKPALDDSFSLRSRIGNNGEREVLLRHSGQLNNFEYRVSASTRENDGMPNYRDSKDLDNLNFSSRYTPNNRNEIWSQFSITRGDIQRANIFPELSQGFHDSDRDVDAWSANFSWDHSISEQQSLKLQFFHNYFDENDMATSYPLSDVFSQVLGTPISPAAFEFITGEPDQQVQIGERSYHTHRSDLEIQYNHIFTSGMQYVVGLGARYDSMKSEAFFPNDGTKSNLGYRLYGNVQLPMSKWLTVNLGGLYESNHTERPHFSPRGSLNFHLNQHQSVRLGYSKAYRIPSLLEEHMNTGLYLASGTTLEELYTHTDDIKAEKVTSLDISYIGKLQSWPISWELRAYREEYNDTIYFYDDHNDNDFLDNEVTRVGNAANSVMYGYDGEITFRPEKNSFIRLHFNVGHMDGNLLTDINREAPRSETQHISLDTFAPKTTLGILAFKRINSWQFNVGYYHVDEMKWGSAGGRNPRYDRLDASISKTLKLSDKQSLIFKLAGQNLNKDQIFEFSSSNEPNGLRLEFEPRYYGSITFKYR
jgi:iron complex outermembrane receptor protein